MEAIINYFLKPENGVLGIIIIMLLFAGGALVKVILNLAKRIDELNKEKDELIKQHAEEVKILNTAMNLIQEKRIGDYDKNSGALVGLGKDLLNSDAGIQKTLDRIVSLFEIKKLGV